MVRSKEKLLVQRLGSGVEFAGRWACEQLKEHYEKEYAVFCNLPPIEGADYGDLAKQAWEKQQKQRRERGR